MIVGAQGYVIHHVSTTEPDSDGFDYCNFQTPRYVVYARVTQIPLSRSNPEYRSRIHQGLGP